MRDTMAHRGPDGFGSWIAGDCRVGMGHRRLSIIDLSARAAQPMSNEDESLWITFNGEIYNHAAIRSELELTGRYTWKTDHSDTEVILHSFEEWGTDCLHRFRGMFAFGLWDARARELWLVRDRVGIKPLYYSQHHGRLTFGSEIKALLEDPEQPRAVHEEAFYHYLSFLTTPAPQTLFAGIKKLAAGTWLRVKEDGSTEERRYWDPWNYTTPLVGVPDEEIAERVLAELRTAVALRKVSDVPVGVFLSGGIDSSTNAALFSEGEEQAVKTFAVAFEGNHPSTPSELPYARRMAREVGAEHHERMLAERDFLEFMPQMVYLQDEPIADPVCAPVYEVSRLARGSGVTVCQLGEGSDELFWGYRGWKVHLGLQRADDLPVPRPLKAIGLGALALAGQDRTLPYEWLRRGAEGQPIFWGGAEAFTQAHKQRLLGPRLRQQFRATTSWEALAPIWQRFMDGAWEPSHLHWMSYVDLNLRLPELLLMRVDKMSMGVGLEARVPFLDHKLIELVLSIPEAAKTRNGTLKYLLKRAVRGMIPDEIIDRRKQGFGVPVDEWLSGELGAEARRRLTTFTAETDFFDRREVERLLERGPGSQVWYLLNFAMWWSRFIAE